MTTGILCSRAGRTKRSVVHSRRSVCSKKNRIPHNAIVALARATFLSLAKSRKYWPELSRFLGIVIGMFYREHGVAHVHALYGEHEISVEVETGTVHGHFPPRALKLVLEWMGLHTPELLENWQLAKQGQPLKRIAPLE